MTDREGVPTESGRFVVGRGVLRVRTTLSGVLRETYIDQWRGEDRIRRGWFVFSTAFGAVTLGRFVSDWVGLADLPLSVGVVLPALLVYTHFLALKLVHGRLRNDISIPLQTIRGVERGSTPTKLRVIYGEFEDIEQTAIEFLTESDADSAVELLRWKGIRIAEVGTEKANLREEIERERAVETETT